MTEPLSSSTRHRLLHRLAVGQAAGRVPSMVAAVARDGELLWRGARGAVGGVSPTSDTQYRIGSLTKTFTAVLVLRLRDEGRLELADRVNVHLPEVALGDVTIAQLLSHTAGLAGETPPPWWERVDGSVRSSLADLLGDGPVAPPGQGFHYSNVGFAVLGAMAARLRGRSWLDLVSSEILEPAGMTRTGAAPTPPHADGWAVHPWADVVLPEPLTDTGSMAPAGQLWSTTEDLARYATVLLGTRPDILDAETAAQLRRPASPPTDRRWHEGEGLGVQLARVRGRALFGHLGTMPGFTCACWIDADEQLAGIVFGNATASPENVSTVAADLIDIVAATHPLIPPAWSPSTGHDRELLELTGVWYWGVAPEALRLGENRELLLGDMAGHGAPSRFRPHGDGTWRGVEGDHRGETLRIVRDADGAVSHLDVGSFVLTREPYDATRPIPGGVDPDGWR